MYQFLVCRVTLLMLVFLKLHLVAIQTLLSKKVTSELPFILSYNGHFELKAYFANK